MAKVGEGCSWLLSYLGVFSLEVMAGRTLSLYSSELLLPIPLPKPKHFQAVLVLLSHVGSHPLTLMSWGTSERRELGPVRERWEELT